MENSEHHARVQRAARMAIVHDSSDHEPAPSAFEKTLARTFLENFIGGCGFVAGGVVAVLVFGAMVR